MTDGNEVGNVTHPTLFEIASNNPNEGDLLKACGDCGNSYPVQKFGVNKRYASGVVAYHHYCLSCRRKQQLVIERALKGGTYQRLYIKQGGRCFVCGAHHERLCIDHDHQTGAVRALLCQNCNKAAGFIKDNPAIAYDLYLYLGNVDKVRRSLGLTEIGQ